MDNHTGQQSKDTSVIESILYWRASMITIMQVVLRGLIENREQ